MRISINSKLDGLNFMGASGHIEVLFNSACMDDVPEYIHNVIVIQSAIVDPRDCVEEVAV